jgi:DNA-binding Xre family transcriptional regulator
MTNKIGYVWHLRRLMAEAGMFATTDLVPLLAERGVRLSREQVYRLVTGTPERLNLAVLVALCDILGCRADDLIESVAPPAKNTTAARAAGASVSQRPRPRRARILPAE